MPLPLGAHGRRAVGHDRGDEAEDVVVRVEQVADAANALHVARGPPLPAAELHGTTHEAVDVAVDADDEPVPVARRVDLGLRPLSLGEPAVDAMAGGARDVADRTLARV